MVKNPKVDTYLIDGCGRCEHYQTPRCKVHTWTRELVELRRIVLECGLVEEYKWSQPTYTFGENNVVMVTAFKDYSCLAFFKGVLLNDAENQLVSPGESSQSSRLMKFTDFGVIRRLEPVIREYIFEAIEVEKTGLKVEFNKQPEAMPEVLQQTLDQNPHLKKAFEALTLGRQRGYILHFSQPKQVKTRLQRIEKCIPKILNGEGFHDAYKAMGKRK